MSSTLQFCGGAGAVTGSNFLLEVDSPSPELGTISTKLLIDCGLQQGMGEEHNWEPFSYDPKEIAYLFVTHAHLDHIGRIPKLVKEGFRGQIISTKATRALIEPLLQDALEILQHHAHHQNKPELYAADDVAAALALWRGVGYHEKISVDDIEVELLDAGHILGSAMVQLTRGNKKILFTGDLGGGNSPLLPPTEDVVGATYVVMEGTYGDRTRPEDSGRFAQLEDVIEDAMARGGTLVIPAFSTERTQDLLFDIRKLYLEKRVPLVPVYLDSPLAEKITSAYLAHPEYFSADIRARVEGGEQIFSFEQLHYAATMDESRKLDLMAGSKIILAGSGMSSGGRVFGHERQYLPDPNSTLLVVGYQAAGTLGRQLIEGVKTLKTYKESIPVKAKIETLYGYSAHRDGEGLLEFANKAAESGTKEIFVVHAEPSAAMFLAQRIRDYLSVKASAPSVGDRVVLEF